MPPDYKASEYVGATSLKTNRSKFTVWSFKVISWNPRLSFLFTIEISFERLYIYSILNYAIVPSIRESHMVSKPIVWIDG